MVSLKIINKKTHQEQNLQLQKDVIHIGRKGITDVLLDVPTVSRHHASVVAGNEGFFLRDEHSGNGTHLNKKKVHPGSLYPLKTGDVITIEDFDIIPEFDGSNPTSANNENIEEEENTDSGLIEIKMFKKVMKALEAENRPAVEGRSDPVTGVKIYIDEEMSDFIIGRDSDCQFQVDSTVISRKHALITRKWGGFSISDLNSKNGVYVNGEKVTEAMLKNKDVIALGNMEFVFTNPHEIDLDVLTAELENRAQNSEVNTDPKIPLSYDALDEAAENQVSDSAQASVAALDEDASNTTEEEITNADINPVEDDSEEKENLELEQNDNDEEIFKDQSVKVKKKDLATAESSNTSPTQTLVVVKGDIISPIIEGAQQLFFLFNQFTNKEKIILATGAGLILITLFILIGLLS